jgi:hypothetical protein
MAAWQRKGKYMNEYGTDRKPEKTTGVEKRLRGDITISHDYDFGIPEYLTTVMGFDIETERVQTAPYDGEVHIKVFETVKHGESPIKRY